MIYWNVQPELLHLGPLTIRWYGMLFALVDRTPRHPAQLYESLAYFICAAILYRIYRNPRWRDARGFIFGIYLVLVFSFRFVIEFFKENQVAFESQLPLDLGQLLSI